MNFNNDNSTQLNIGSTTFTPSYSSKTAPNLILNDSTSGIYNPSLNTIKFFTNNIDAFTIDENQCLYGNATGLTNLGYSNIINKPSTFPSDWGTLANKPSTFPADMTNIYTKTQTDSFLNMKQNILTFQSPLENAANTISLNTTNLITTTGGQTINGTLTTSGYLYTQNIQPINTGLAQNLNLTQRLTGNINFNCEGAGTINCIINGVNRFYVNSAGNAVLAGNLYEGGQLLSGKYQAKLTASTALLGIGSAITEINYDNITTNKPDLTVYATTTALNGKENTLTFSSPLTRTLNAVSIDLSAYQPTLTFNSPMTKTGNNVSIDLSSYATTTALNGKENTLTFSSPLTRTTNTIGIDLSAYSTTATNNSTYLKLSGGQLTGNLGFGVAPSSTILINCYNASSTAFQNIQMMNNASEFFYFGLAGNAVGNGTYLNNFFIQASKSLVFNSTNKTHLAVPDMIINDATVGINTSTPNTTYKLDVNGNINGLILYEGGTSLASKYATSASLDTTYLRLNGANSMTENLTANKKIYFANTLASAPAFGITGGNGDRIILYAGTAGAYPYSIGIDNFIQYYSVPAGSAHRFLAAGTNLFQIQGSVSTFSNKLQVLTAGTGAPTLAATGGTGDMIILKQGSATVHPYSFGLNTTEMWYSVPSGNNHNFYINGSSVATISSGGFVSTGTIGGTTLYEGGVSLASKYLQSASLANYVLKAGDTMTGALTVNNNINITGSGTNKLIFDNVLNNRKIELSTNHSIGVDTNGMIFAASSFRFAKATNINDIVFTVTPVGDLSFSGTVYSGAVSTGGTVFATGTITGGSFTEGGTTLNSKYLRLSGANNMTGNLNITNNGKLIFNNNIDDMRIQLWDGYGFGINGNTLRYNSPNTHRFYTGTATSMVINSAGNMGIGTDTPRARLDVYNNDMIVRGTNEGDVARLYLGTPYTVDSALKTAIIAEGINSWSRCKLHLCVNTILNNSSAYNASVADARLTIDTNGNVAIGQTSAAYPLVVTGTTNSFTITSASRKYDEYGPIGNTPPYNMTGIVAYFNGNVLTPGFYVAFSDERLKKEIEELSNDFALQTIMKLKPIKYNLIDNIYNNNINYGFSAQEVQKVLPEAVISTKHYLPNIYQNVDKVDNANSNIMIDANIIGSNLNVNDNIRIITHSNEEQIKKIVSINDNIITLDSKIDNYNDGDPLFLYGKEQEDIRCVNHNFLYNVNIKATQVLYEIIMKQQQEIEKLTNALISSNIISPL